MKPRIGIVVPVGRYTRELETTLNSLIMQEVEVAIVVYDASNDPRTKIILNKFRRYLFHVHHGDDGGQANAILMGWEKLDAEIVGWLNDDDNLGPKVLSEVISTIDDNPSCVGVYGPSIVIDANGRFLGMHPAVKSDGLSQIFSDNIISQPSCFVKYSFVKQVGGIDNKLQFTMDWDLWARLLSAVPNGIIYNEEILSAVTFSANTKTDKLAIRRLIEIYKLRRKYNSIKKSLVTVFSFVKWGLRQKIKRRNNREFFITRPGIYKYWNYNDNIVRMKLFGQLTSENIDLIQQINGLKILSSHNNSYEFAFSTIIERGKLIEIIIPKTINYQSIAFL